MTLVQETKIKLDNISFMMMNWPSLLLNKLTQRPKPLYRPYFTNNVDQ